MGTSSTVLTGQTITRPQPIPRADYVMRQGILKLLAVKDSDVRILTLEYTRWCESAAASKSNIAFAPPEAARP